MPGKTTDWTWFDGIQLGQGGFFRLVNGGLQFTEELSQEGCDVDFGRGLNEEDAEYCRSIERKLNAEEAQS